MAENQSSTTRRDFIRTSMAGITALTILPSSVIGGLGHRAPSDKLNIAIIGAGGVGFRTLSNLEDENIVALCDVDWDYAKKAGRRWSNAQKYSDYRVMLQQEKGIDAVVVATPDHTHSVASMAAMQLQKHVYVQAPMAHSIFEVRRMNESARVFNVVSQVGNQSASSDEVREICEIIWSGAIGEIREVHAWTTQPRWQQGMLYPDKKMPVPRDLNWDLFIGPATEIPYNSTYTPFGWRAWWNFGNGALGSMGPHILEPVFRALKLNAPFEVEASSTQVNLQSAPLAEKITFGFNRRDNLPKLALPPVTLHWYDGGLMPELPNELPYNISIGNEDGGAIFIGAEGMLICGAEGKNYTVFKRGETVTINADRKLHRIANPYQGGHEKDWVRACKESTENRLAAAANFESQTALTETLLVGTIAVRMQSLRKILNWDSSQMRFLNINDEEEFAITKQGAMYVENGIPKFDSNIARYNASRFVDQTVRPIYRSGWQQI